MNAITIELSELRTLLARVIPFAADSKLYAGALPVIESVYLQVRGEYLIATATDRYVLGMARTRVEDGDGFEALLKVTDAKHILTTFKSRKGILTKVTLTREGSTADGATLTVTLADGLFAGADDLTAKYGLIDGQFPKTHELFSKWEAPAEAAATGYNPKYLARFAHVTDNRDEPIQLASGGSEKSTIVQAGDYFLGAIMPVRLHSGLISDMPSWTAMFPPPVAQAEAKKAPAAKKTAPKPRTRVRKPAA